jgi:hypothetical protein
MVMNEQIQNLKDKIWTEEYWTNPNTDKLLPAQLNRFAELIVRECADLFEVEWGEEKLTGNDVGYVVKKHFGVES